MATNGTSKRVATTRKPSARTAAPARAIARVVPLVPRLRARVSPPKQDARKNADDGVLRCAKCGSTFVEREPAFLHCRYCGTLARIPKASLADQELYEIRSGLRIAS